MSVLEKSVRDLIARYVAGSISLDDLSAQLPDRWGAQQSCGARHYATRSSSDGADLRFS